MLDHTICVALKMRTFGAPLVERAHQSKRLLTLFVDEHGVDTRPSNQVVLAQLPLPVPISGGSDAILNSQSKSFIFLKS